jgi:hypothetical protein
MSSFRFEESNTQTFLKCHTYEPRTSRKSYLLVTLSSNFFFPKRGILQKQRHELIERSKKWSQSTRNAHTGQDYKFNYKAIVTMLAYTLASIYRYLNICYSCFVLWLVHSCVHWCVVKKSTSTEGEGGEMRNIIRLAGDVIGKTKGGALED